MGTSEAVVVVVVVKASTFKAAVVLLLLMLLSLGGEFSAVVSRALRAPDTLVLCLKFLGPFFGTCG